MDSNSYSMGDSLFLRFSINFGHVLLSWLYTSFYGMAPSFLGLFYALVTFSLPLYTPLERLISSSSSRCSVWLCSSGSYIACSFELFTITDACKTGEIGENIAFPLGDVKIDGPCLLGVKGWFYYYPDYLPF